MVRSCAAQQVEAQNPLLFTILWQRIVLIVNLTTLALLSVVPVNTHHCFELFGFDIIVGADWHPSLLEVNCSPALTKVNLPKK
jgi:hypothetical protein